MVELAYRLALSTVAGPAPPVLDDCEQRRRCGTVPTMATNELAVHVRGLVKRFGDVVALDGIDLEVPVGSVLGLLGPNGAGKTTTVRVLTTTLVPDEGTATVLGIDVTQDPAAVRSRIGLAGQFAAVDEMLTGTENVDMIGRLSHLAPKFVKRRGAELLERFNLSQAADRQVRTYSGGMRRRLDLAAALLHQPPVVFLDEPTTGLDPRSRNDLWDVIRELVAAGTTILLTTQYLEEADHLADRIMVINDGQVIAEGTAAELKADLGSTILEVNLQDHRAAERAGGEVGSMASHVEIDGERLQLTVADGAKTAMDVLRTLDAAGIDVAGLTLREPSLDDVFLSLTGHRAEISEEGPGEDDAGGSRPGGDPPPVPEAPSHLQTTGGAR